MIVQMAMYPIVLTKLSTEYDLATRKYNYFNFKDVSLTRKHSSKMRTARLLIMGVVSRGVCPGGCVCPMGCAQGRCVQAECPGGCTPPDPEAHPPRTQRHTPRPRLHLRIGNRYELHWLKECSHVTNSVTQVSN